MARVLRLSTPDATTCSAAESRIRPTRSRLRLCCGTRRRRAERPGASLSMSRTYPPRQDVTRARIDHDPRTRSQSMPDQTTDPLVSRRLLLGSAGALGALTAAGQLVDE